MLCGAKFPVVLLTEGNAWTAENEIHGFLQLCFMKGLRAAAAEAKRVVPALIAGNPT